MRRSLWTLQQSLFTFIFIMLPSSSVVSANRTCKVVKCKVAQTNACINSVKAQYQKDEKICTQEAKACGDKVRERCRKKCRRHRRYGRCFLACKRYPIRACRFKKNRCVKKAQERHDKALPLCYGQQTCCVSRKLGLKCTACKR